MGIFDTIGDGIVGTFTVGQCDDGGCGSGHRGSGLEAGAYNQIHGIVDKPKPKASSTASGALGLDFGTLSAGNKKIMVYAGFALFAYFILKLSFDIIIKLI